MSRNSQVFAAFLDCTKAFDRISHHGLFIKLMERKIHLCYLLIFVFWHLNMTCRVKWGSVMSEEFEIPLGTKQGGILSPKFFSLYVDDLIKLLRKRGIGWHLLELFVACIMFADDLALVAPSRTDLQKMINICTEYCGKFCLEFNSKKSKVMTFGKCLSSSAPLTINGENVEFVHELKYLGTMISSGNHLYFNPRTDVANFFRASNSILSVLTDAHEHTLLQLVYTNCVPILTYASAVKLLSSEDMLYCNKAMNDVLRKVFGFKDWRSIRELREVFGFKSFTDILRSSQRRFHENCKTHLNPIIRSLSNLD